MIRGGRVFCQNSCSLIYADYRTRDSRGNHEVLSYDFISQSSKVLVVFDREHIRHIHGIWPSELEDVIYITTGDSDEESGIYSINVSTKKLTCLGKGSQAWRAVEVVEKKGILYWGSDSEVEQNYVYALDLQSGNRTIIGEVDGPVYFVKPIRDGIYFFTGAEGCLSNREGNGSSAWLLNESDLALVLKMGKDTYPNLFMYGFMLPIHGDDFYTYPRVLTLGLTSPDYSIVPLPTVV